MAEFSSPLSRENRLQIARSTFSSSAITSGRSLAFSPLVSAPVPQQDPETLRLLEDNQSGLITISNGIAEVRNSVDSLNQSLGAVSAAFYNNSILEQNRESLKQQQERMLAEDALRDETEALIERKAGAEINNSIQPVAEKTTGTLNSLMGVFSSLFLGWLSTGGIQGVQRLAQESGDRFKQVKSIVGSGLGFIGDGLSNIKNSFDNIIGNVTRVASNIKDAVIKGLIVAPFRAMFGGGNDAGKGAGSSADDAGKGVASAADDAGKGVASAADDAGKGVASAADDAGKGLKGMGSTILRGASGLVSAAFGGLDFMERKKEGQTTTQAAAGAGGSVVTSEIMAFTGARLGSIFGPLGTIGGAVFGGAGGWMLGGGIADIMTGVSDKKEQPQPKPKVQSTTQAPTTVVKPPAAPPQQPVQPQTQFLSPPQIQMGEEKAESVTPKANFSVNFGDQISNYTNKLFGTQETESTQEPKGVSESDLMNSIKESVKYFNLPFDTSKVEGYEEENQYRSPKISQAVKSNIPKETTFGPLPEPAPTIVVAPIASQPQPVVNQTKFSGSATDVPNISSSNPDNFYVLYSKTQYNVVA